MTVLYELTESPFFGIALTIFAYEIGVWLNKKSNQMPLVNPLLIAVVLIISILTVFHIPLENYNQGGSIINMFLAPATAALAVTIYARWDLLKRNWLSILAGSLVGAAVSMGSVFGLCKLFGLDDVSLYSLLPKSVTTPIAVELSTQTGGVPSVTVAAVVITGITGAILCPVLIKLLRLNSPIAAGVAIGTCSHALGTTRALELGETEGAMSGIAIGVAGLLTVGLSLLLQFILQT